MSVGNGVRCGIGTGFQFHHQPVRQTGDGQVYLNFQSRAARSPDTSYTACIYRDGQILRSIPLDQVSETCRFTVDATDGGYNIVEVSPGAIAIVEADCPDKLCVLQEVSGLRAARL